MKLGDNDQKYIRALNGANIAVWEWNLKDENMFFSSNAQDMLEKNLSEFNSLFEFIDGVVISEDKMNVKLDLNSFISGNGTVYLSEFRIVTRKGKLRWILIKGNTIRNFQGELELMSGALTDVTYNKKLEEEIEYLAYYDPLTELPNRVLFMNNLKKTLEKAQASHQGGALICIDIDDFKLINDTYGHDYGDLLLKVFSKLLTTLVRGIGNVHRLGADEFIILINNIKDIKDISNICYEIIYYFKYPFEIKGKQIYITASFGIAIFPDDSVKEFELYKYSDLAMYQSKLNGKNTITFFHKSMAEEYYRKLMIEQELKLAVENGELYMMYQPQIDSVNKKIIGFESLIRWNSSKLGFVSPAEFIPIAESSGIILKIGEWILRTVCKKINYLKSQGIDFGIMSVNISPIQIKRKNFIDKFLEICKENSVEPSLLEIEITEGTLIDLHHYRAEVLNQAIEKGIKVAVDDFGTGYSSLTYLTVLPINTLKIDKSFIDKITSESSKAVVKTIIDLSKALGYKIIAEGVETKEQLELLQELGGNIIQGYYFSKPLLENEVEVFKIEKN